MPTLYGQPALDPFGVFGGYPAVLRPGSAEAQLSKGQINGFRFDGVAAYGAIPDSASQAIGTSDFFIFAQVMLDDWTPSAVQPIFNKITGNNGVKFNLTTAGLLQLQIGNGSNFTTYSYSSTAAVPTSDQMFGWVGVVADRDGSVRFYWNGVQLGDAVDMSGSVAQSATAAATAYLMRDGSSYSAGRCVGLWFGNYAPDASTVARYYLAGVPDSDKWGSFAASYTANWSAGVDSWGNTRSTGAGNQDGVSDGTTSKDDCYRTYASADAGATHFAYRTNVTPHLKRLRIAGSYYIPDSGGTTYLDGFRMIFGGSSSGSTGLIGDRTTVGEWTDFSVEAINQTINASYNQINFVCRKAGSTAFTGANSATDDLFYLHGLTVTQLGCVVCLEGSDQCVNAYQWQDSSTNLNDCTISGATMLINRPRGRVRGVTNTNGNQQLLGQTVLPTNAFVTGIYTVAASGTPTVSVGSASAGTDYINAQALATAWSRETQTTPLLAPTQNVWVNSNGTMNVTTVVFYELPAA